MYILHLALKTRRCLMLWQCCSQQIGKSLMSRCWPSRRLMKMKSWWQNENVGRRRPREALTARQTYCYCRQRLWLAVIKELIAAVSLYLRPRQRNELKVCFISTHWDFCLYTISHYICQQSICSCRLQAVVWRMTSQKEFKFGENVFSGIGTYYFLKLLLCQ